MSFINIDNPIKNAVNKLNDLFPKSFVYIYNGEERQYNIVHNLGERLFDRDVAEKVNNILYYDLFQKNIMNINLVEDENAVSQNTFKFEKQHSENKYKKIHSSTMVLQEVSNFEVDTLKVDKIA